MNRQPKPPVVANAYTATALDENGTVIEIPFNLNCAPNGVFAWSESVECPRCFGRKNYCGFGVCFLCRGEGTVSRRRHAYTGEAYAARVKRKAAAEARKTKKQIAEWNARDEQLMSIIGLTASQMADCLNYENCVTMIWDLRLKANKPLSEKQQSALKNWMNSFQRKADFVPPPAAELETGKRITITARIASAKYVDNAFGFSLKGLFVVDSDAGESKIWMTVPSQIEEPVGKTVEITTTLEPSNDKGFYYGKRPKLVAVK